MSYQDDKYLINSVLRAARILESFSLEKATYSHAELSRKLGLNKASLTRLLYTLERAGFLEKNAETGRFGLTVKLYQIGSVYINMTGISQVARPYLSELASQCNESSHLSVLHEFEVLYIDKVECSRPIRMMSYIGSKLPAFCTGTGKVFLADLAEADLENFFRSVRLKQLTANTITEPAKLRNELDGIRKRGYAIDNAENEAELVSVAAPVRDRTGRVVAAVSVAGPIYRMTKKKIRDSFIPAVTQAAGKISGRLGYMQDIT